MADSSSNLDLISASQASKEVSLNSLADPMSNAALFGRRAATTTGLTWGMYGGKYRKADGTILTVANFTQALTASATNYILETNGVVSKVTAAPAGWPGPLASSATALYEVVCGTTAVTSYIDYRAPAVTSAGTGSVTSVAMTVPAEFSVAGSPITSSGTLAVTKANQSANLVYAGPTTGGAAAPTFRALVAADIPTQPFDVTAFYPGAPTASAIIVRVPVARAVTFPDDFAGSYGKASVAATGSTAFDVQKNGVSVGTITFAAAATTATFVTSGTTVVLAAGDVISIHAPGTADATLANIGFVLAGTR